jgi:hypothetical protein
MATMDEMKVDLSKENKVGILQLHTKFTSLIDEKCN